MTEAATLTTSDQVSILVAMDNFHDGLLLSEESVHRYGIFRPGVKGKVKLPPPVSAEHGFSCYIEVTSNGQNNSLLLDFGMSHEGLIYNIKAMGIDILKINAAVLSHGHFDHYGGLEELGKELDRLGVQSIPLYVGEEAFLKRHFCVPGLKVDLGCLDQQMVSDAGYKVTVIKQHLEIFPGVLVIGSVPRITDFEQGSPALMVERNGNLEQDDFVGELSLVFNVADKGLVILTSCAHAGIVNIVSQAVALTGVDSIHAILGGFHLTGASLENVKKTVEQLSSLSLDKVVPMHCTGFHALKSVSANMAEAFTLYSVGTKYLF